MGERLLHTLSHIIGFGTKQIMIPKSTEIKESNVIAGSNAR